MSRRLALLSLTVLLAACTLPRGAPMQRELLAGAQSEDRSFQLLEVTRANVTKLRAWPLPPAAARSFAPWPANGRRSPDALTLAPGDQLAVTVFDNEENSLLTGVEQKSTTLANLTVARDGNIFLPYIGKVSVQGLTVDDSRNRIQGELARALPSAQVVVVAQPGRRNTVDLIGGVASPGSVPLPDRGYSVLSLIAQGGGADPGVENPLVRLVRGGKTYGVALRDIYDSAALDLSLRGGDKVILEEDPRYFLALGASGQQSQLPFLRKDMTALDALTQMGGISPSRADPRGILVLREYGPRQLRRDDRGPDRERVIFTVDLTSTEGLFSARNFRIYDRDVVLVTESPITNARTVFGLVGQVFGLANQVNN